MRFEMVMMDMSNTMVGIQLERNEDPVKHLPPVVPPINFSLVAPGVYRSGHPNRKNFGFLCTLKFKGIMWVSPNV